MPIYAYRCESCGFQQDVLQKMSDPRLVDCPSCGAPTLQKQVTAAGFQLKGSGWYVTDFRESGKKDAAKSAEPDGASGEKASSDTASTSGDAAPVAPGAAPSATPPAAPAPTPAAPPPAKAQSSDG